MKLSMKKLLILVFFISFAVSTKAQNSPYAQGYFGEPIFGLTVEDEQSFDRGFQLFVKRWDEADQNSHNASSCVSCHSVPMPGGSGMSFQALVNIKPNSAEIVQRINGHSISGDKTEIRRTPPLFGLGLIEFAEQRKINGVLQPFFGALAKDSSLELFILKAFAMELGLYTEESCKLFTSQTENPTYSCIAILNKGNIQDVLSFIRFTSAPPKHQAPSNNNQISTFIKIGCGKCHTSSITTSSDAPPPLKNITVNSFTDLKTHDLGTGIKIRTTPLWGVNSFGPPYWHDASANSIDTAINMHKGEAKDSLDKYLSLTSKKRNMLLKFISDL